jgi:hypothetical protein
MNTTNDQPAPAAGSADATPDIAALAARIRAVQDDPSFKKDVETAQEVSRIIAEYERRLATAQAKIAELEKLADCAFVALKQAEGNLTGFDCKGSTIEVVRRSIKELAARKEGQP